jgi:hypothetical protein
VDVAGIGWNLFQTLSPALLAGLSWLSLKATQLISAKVKNEYLKGVLLRLDDAVLAAVREVQQVVVDGLKAASSGPLTPAERIKVKQIALASIKSHLGQKGLSELAHIFGLEGGTLETVLTTRVEAAVHDLKVERRSAAASASIARRRSPTSRARGPARGDGAGTLAEASDSSPKAPARRR